MALNSGDPCPKNCGGRLNCGGGSHRKGNSQVRYLTCNNRACGFRAEEQDVVPRDQIRPRKFTS